MKAQYRSAIFYHNENQNSIAQKVIKTLNTNKAFDNPIVTEISALQNFIKLKTTIKNITNSTKEQAIARL